MTDIEFISAILDRGPASTNEILAASFRDRGCGLTVHSRIADLRRQMEASGEGTVLCWREGTERSGRGRYVYAKKLADRQLELAS